MRRTGDLWTIEKHVKANNDFVSGRKVMDIFSFFPLEKILRNYFVVNILPDFLATNPQFPEPVLVWPDILYTEEGEVHTCTLQKCVELILTTGNVGA